MRNLHLFAYHEQALERAADALYDVTFDRRRFHVLTVAIPTSLAPQMYALAQRFEDELLQLIDSSTAPKDEVMQINLQLFSVLTPELPTAESRRKR